MLHWSYDLCSAGKPNVKQFTSWPLRCMTLSLPISSVAFPSIVRPVVMLLLSCVQPSAPGSAYSGWRRHAAGHPPRCLFWHPRRASPTGAAQQRARRPAFPRQAPCQTRLGALSLHWSELIQQSCVMPIPALAKVRSTLSTCHLACTATTYCLLLQQASAPYRVYSLMRMSCTQSDPHIVAEPGVHG